MSRRIPDHPGSIEWMALALGELPAAERTKLVTHRPACASCRSLAEAAELLLRAATPGQFEAVPEGVRRRALAAFEARTGRPIPRVARMRIVPVSLQGTSMAVGLRGTANEHRCTLAAGVHRIDLEWTAAFRGWELRGQVHGGLSAAKLAIELAQGGERRLRPGVRGFFGPVRLGDPGIRVRFETSSRAYTSPWLRVDRPPKRRP